MSINIYRLSIIEDSCWNRKLKELSEKEWTAFPGLWSLKNIKTLSTIWRFLKKWLEPSSNLCVTAGPSTALPSITSINLWKQCRKNEIRSSIEGLLNSRFILLGNGKEKELLEPKWGWLASRRKNDWKRLSFSLKAWKSQISHLNLDLFGYLLIDSCIKEVNFDENHLSVESTAPMKASATVSDWKISSPR